MRLSLVWSSLNCINFSLYFLQKWRSFCMYGSTVCDVNQTGALRTFLQALSFCDYRLSVSLEWRLFCLCIVYVVHDVCVCVCVCSTMSRHLKHSNSAMCHCDGGAACSRENVHGKEAYEIFQLDGHWDERFALQLLFVTILIFVQ